MTLKDILYTNILVDNVYSKILQMENWILINMRAYQVWIFCVTCDFDQYAEADWVDTQDLCMKELDVLAYNVTIKHHWGEIWADI